MKKENIVRYTSDTMPDDTQTDWTRVNAMTTEEIERNALEDPDAPPITEEQWKTAVLVVPDDEGKERIAIWVDKDILRHFGKGSKNYQKRLNAALRKIMVAELLYGKNVSA
jgi:uncharacterized protein (DUF4415 family)